MSSLAVNDQSTPAATSAKVIQPAWVRIVATAVSGRRVGPERVLYFDLPSEAYL